MDLEPVPDSPALVVNESEDWLVVADLHVGIEVQLRAAGFNIPTQMPKMLSSLVALCERADNLLILGDLKHKIPSVGRREDREIRHLMGELLDEYERIVVVAGNHDGGLASALPEGVEAMSSRGMRFGDVGVFHGHVWPSDEVMGANRIIMGHTHPSVVFVDSLGGRRTEKCWLRSKLDCRKLSERYETCPEELVVVPAFNPLLTGTPVNAEKGSMLGPIFRNHVADRATYKAYLLDGTNLGNPLELNKRSAN